MIIICFYPVTHFTIPRATLKEKLRKVEKISVYLLFNKINKILSSTKTCIQSHSHVCTCERIWYVFFLFTSWALGESNTHVCLLSINGTLGEYDVNINSARTFWGESWTCWDFHDCMSLSQINIYIEYMYVEENVLDCF